MHSIRLGLRQKGDTHLKAPPSVNSTSLLQLPRVGSSPLLYQYFIYPLVTIFLLFPARIFTAFTYLFTPPKFRCSTPFSCINMGSTSPPFPFHPRQIDTLLPLKIGIIGAGISGICLSIRLRQYIPSASIIIWEKNPDVGGTWFENRYPGVKCDIPSHVYQYTFEPNSQWSSFFAGGEEIEEYIRVVSAKYGVREMVGFERRVGGARWMGREGKWEIDVVGVDGREREKVDVDVLINATGCLNNWKLPDIEGLSSFEGKIVHSACWDQSW
jgi:hypothetical protein